MKCALGAGWPPSPVGAARPANPPPDGCSRTSTPPAPERHRRLPAGTASRRLRPVGQGQPGAPLAWVHAALPPAVPEAEEHAQTERSHGRIIRPSVCTAPLSDQLTLVLSWGRMAESCNSVIHSERGIAKWGGQRIRSSGNVLAESILRTVLRSGVRFRWLIKYSESPHVKARLARKRCPFPGPWPVLSRRNGRMVVPCTRSVLMFP